MEPTAPARGPRPIALQLAALCVIVLLASAALKWTWPDSNLTQRGFPFMVLVSVGGLIGTLWLWFLRKRRTNGMLATFVLANMAAMALMILPFALATRPFRRGNDPKPLPLAGKSPTTESAAQPVAPAALAALGYLPEDCNVVAAINVSELAQQPIGKKLLAPPKVDGGGEPQPWLLEQGLGRVDKLTGIKAADVDHIVFGTKGDTGLPTILLVVRTKKPYDRAAIARAQAPVVPVQHRDRDLYQFSLQLAGKGPFGFGGQGALWCANSQTLMLMFNLALKPGDKELLTDQPRTGAQIPPRAVRSFLSERVAAGTLIWWAATDVQQPQLIAGMVPGAAADPELAKLVQQARSVTAGLRLQQDCAVLANVECSDQATASTLVKLLERQRLPGLDPPKVAAPAPDELHPWVALQMRGSPESVVEALRPLRLIGGLGKK